MNKFMLFSILQLWGASVASAEQSLGDFPSEFEKVADEMNVSEPERAAVLESIRLTRQISKVAEKKNGHPFRRDAHAKATGCVRATFSVNMDIPKHLQYSVFSQPGKEYRAWIRFSNGDMLVRADKKPDARGMAVKLMDVEGPRIAPEFSGNKTQDFVMVNTAAFFNSDVFDYAEDLKYLAKLERTRWFISLFPPKLHPKKLYRALQMVSTKISTPLEPQYYSILPVRLGKTALKYSTKPCSGMTFTKAKDTGEFDYLTNQMATKLKNEAACFDFMVQPKVTGANMPLDDATVIWSEKDSPFVPVARINIPPQHFTGEEQSAFCENLSMNPWHGVGEWQPLGSLNRARRLVYNAVSQYRHAENDVSRFEPDSWCLKPGECKNPKKDLLVREAKWPLARCFDPLFESLEGDTPKSECRTDY